MRKEYKVVSCPSCGHLQITFAERYFTCNGCGKRNYVSSKHVLYRSENQEDARAVLLSLKTKKAYKP
ncbi:MAG: hypothetical protein RMJ14_03195 [Nitrososphaerota archaeon]|nr:hypothetical protein [Aigarchaeota archaeon]MDW8076627.1 hypothetical protein [Nitrososphaerota archaeon]